MRIKRVLGALLAVIVGILGVLVAAPATAAPTFATEATVSNLAFSKETISTGSDTALSGNWSLPDYPTAPAGFTLTLPEGLRGIAQTFNLLDDDGQPMGECVVTTNEMVCTMDPAYIAANPTKLQGTFNLWMYVRTRVTETTKVTYEFGDASASITVRGSNNCETDCYRGERGSKFGEYRQDTGDIRWIVRVPVDKDGMEGGEEVTVTDILGPDQTANESNLTVLGTRALNSIGYPHAFTDVTDAVGQPRAR